jgi:hypothetical protein
MLTPLKRWLRNMLERWLGCYYEGPPPPARLSAQVLLFAQENPHATRAEWSAFCMAHAEECYRTGWVRGYEWYGRDGYQHEPAVDPELLLTVQYGDSWRDAPLRLDGPDEEAPEATPVLHNESVQQYNAAVQQWNAQQVFQKPPRGW